MKMALVVLSEFSQVQRYLALQLGVGAVHFNPGKTCGIVVAVVGVQRAVPGLKPESPTRSGEVGESYAKLRAGLRQKNIDTGIVGEVANGVGCACKRR